MLIFGLKGSRFTVRSGSSLTNLPSSKALPLGLGVSVGTDIPTQSYPIFREVSPNIELWV